MYRILIVDDERLIRKGLIAKLAHNNVSCSWIGEAGNGKEALEIIKAESPDIVITDIKMPVMDGIQLIRHCHEKFPDVKFLIMSGYAEFSYAEQALNMGVSAYILKPVDDEKFVKSINKIMKELSYSRNASKNARDVAVLEKDRDRLIRERTLNQLFHSSGIIDRAKLLEKIGLEAGEAGCYYILAIIHVDSSSYYQSPFNYDDLVLIKFSIKNILEEIECNCGKIIVDNQKDINQVLILFYGDDSRKIKTCCNNYIRNIYSKIRKHLHLSLTIGISGVEDKLTSEIYRQARLAYEQRLVLGGNQIFFYDKIANSSLINVPEHKFKLLQRCMEISDFNGIKCILDDIFLTGEGWIWLVFIFALPIPRL
ncbi:MAG: response regulator [Clostridiaceae bacterium]|nr:response regulator [Clostridiaceae bacterium]